MDGYINGENEANQEFRDETPKVIDVGEGYLVLLHFFKNIWMNDSLIVSPVTVLNTKIALDQRKRPNKCN